jgi:UDP-N-acetylglucosamine 4-epimerase
VPLSPYAVSKLCGENYARAFTDVYGLETVALRYFNIFGPRQDPQSEYAAVIPRFVLSALRGQAPTIFGDGCQSRDFTYVANAVEANLLACHAPRAAGRAMNVGTGERHSLRELWATVTELVGRDIEPLLAPPRAGDVLHSMADIRLAREFLDYKPSIGFREGLERTVAYFSARYSAESAAGASLPLYLKA